MSTLLQHIKSALLALSNTEGSVYDSASDGARRMRVALGLAVTVVPVLSAIFMSHFLYVALGSLILAVVIGLLWTAIVGIFDFMLVSGTARWNLTLIPRLGLAVLIGYMVAVPMELKLFEDRIQQHLEQENRVEHEARMKRLKGASGLSPMEARIDTLEQRTRTLRGEVQRASRIQECELTGADQIEGVRCSGTQGRGPVYRNAVQNEERLRRQVRQIESELQQLRARRDNLRGKIEADNEPLETLSDPLAQYEALEEITESSDAAAALSWAFHLFFIIIEVMLVLAKLVREEDDYDAAKKHIIGAKKDLDRERTERFKEKRIEEIKTDPLSSSRPAIMELLSWQQRGPRSASGREGLRGEEPREKSRREDAPNRAGDEEEGRREDADGTSARNHSPLRNGRALYSNVWIVLLTIVTWGAAEFFSPAAPLQRLAGNVVNAMPQSGLAAMVGDAAAQRYEHIGRLIEGQGRQGVISADGVVLARHTADPDFPEPLRTYLVQVENHRFYRRYVVDGEGFGRVALSSIKEGHITGGGSGLIQQLSGSVVLRNGGATSKGHWWQRLAAKPAEYFIACGLRDRFSPEKLLRFYMQGVYLGRGSRGPIEGFEEAAWAYFDAPAGRLSKAQQLALVALLPAPNSFVGNASAFKVRYETVVGQLLGEDAITAAEAKQLRQTRPAMQRPRVSAEAHEVRLATRHAQGYVQEHATDSVGTIRSTISAAASVAARRQLLCAVRDLERRTGADDLEGFVLVADGNQLVAMIGSESGWGGNRADMISGYRPGSVMKPFYYAEHLAQGGSVRDRLPVRPQTFTPAGGQPWHPENYTRRYDDHGPMPLDRALARSVNVAAASVAVGPAAGQLQRRLASVGYEGFAPYPSSVLGARAVKPARLFRLLQAFTRPYGAIPQRIQLEMAEPVRSVSVWPAAAAGPIARAMSLTVDDPHGTLSAGRSRGWTGRTHRGKTGTAQGHRAASLFVMRPGGLTVLMGVFRRSGQPMTYESGGGVAGGTLLPYVDALLESDALKQRAGRTFEEDLDPVRPPVLKAAHAPNS